MPVQRRCQCRDVNGSEQGADLGALLSTEDLSVRSDALELILGQQDSLVAELPVQDSQLCFEILKSQLLLSIPPGGDSVH